MQLWVKDTFNDERRWEKPGRPQKPLITKFYTGLLEQWIGIDLIIFTVGLMPFDGRHEQTVIVR